MRRGLLLVLTVSMLAAAGATAEARIQNDLVCWVPDCEFPVDCDGEE
jgi:hypothetical protein